MPQNRTKATPKAAKKTGLHAVSPLAPKRFAKLPPLEGVVLAAGEAGVRYKNRTDVMLAIFEPGTKVAGVFTKSKAASAPVDWCKACLPHGTARALVVNSGNANAFTGRAGLKGAGDVAVAAASVTGCGADEVYMASTGVIGEPLPAEKITAVLGDLKAKAHPNRWREAAEAIMTTDTYPKLAKATAKIGGKPVQINGIAKGSGMIAPDMATMLSFVVTDANLPAKVLQQLLSEGVKPSFNSITVDSDTSTSDTLLLFATGKAGNKPVRSATDPALRDFKKKLDAVLLDLALQVVRDGEGAGKLITITVQGAEDDAAAKKVALSIANSPLVKTAVAGNDANWGRVVMAVGKSGEAADRDRLKIWFGKELVAEKGERAPGYNEAKATKEVSKLEVEITVDLRLGKGKAKVWTCDLTHGYIDINGSYRS
ncbi:glutamate N-acetyltransferase/amino-acid N-acetyltransferase [Rhizomicrobium palustre]|uniref:Arginine biosynthesis bifunctional protein ArgJ n=1 Tax=Rhizomicrobium palustre TaxID=189966 RepID=A0A846N494_9PROT|nr:bifunctional glutamate N-acetyltransferase/amino-acid acetyltransferase ArgJ [Rhizomicrobium palustre]NIK90022.1 glutamate N-acetyltransferase/amino-acid N-acetyltransferase [Rhizomicrobium palustre]